MPGISVLRRLQQEDHNFEISLGYIVSLRSARAIQKDSVSKHNKTKQNTAQKHKNINKTHTHTYKQTHGRDSVSSTNLMGTEPM
jgi:ABC-type nickel/cobalt efflux system permease component RcnA